MKRPSPRKPEPRQREAPRWVVLLLALAAITLLPWAVLIGHALPSTHRAQHWDIAWAGFDVALGLLLLAVAVAALRRSGWLGGAASAAATLLLVDAWFDILTSASGAELAVATGEALLVELPLAVLCLLIASRAKVRVEDARPVSAVVRPLPAEALRTSAGSPSD